MQSSVIDKYCSAFSSLNRASTKFGMASHKPVLLIAFIEMVEKEIVGVFEDEGQIFKVISIIDGINGNADRVG